jgi:predicted metalloprotease
MQMRSDPGTPARIVVTILSATFSLLPVAAVHAHPCPSSTSDAEADPTAKPASKPEAKAERRARRKQEEAALRRSVPTWLVDLNRFWREEFPRQGYRGWKDAKVVVYSLATNTPCGRRRLGHGALYCVKNLTVYVPAEGLFDVDVPGAFKHAFALAHEVGHHVQLGLHLTADVAREHTATKSDQKRRDLKIRHELQADCFAGVWMHSLKARGTLADDDLAAVRATVAAVGDDRLKTSRDQRERWKHGSSEARLAAFETGFAMGSVDPCKRIVAEPEKGARAGSSGDGP